MSSKLYEIPEDVARILRNTGVTVVTKHYVEDVEAEQREEAERYNAEADRKITEQMDAAIAKAWWNKPEDGVASSRIPAHLTERQPKRRYTKYNSRNIVEVGNVTPKELNLRGGRRFYGEKAQALLLQRKSGMKRNALTSALCNCTKYRADDTRHTISCQITNLVKLGVLSYKENK